MNKAQKILNISTKLDTTLKDDINTNSKHLVLVVGMGRSGTSLLSRSLKVFGGHHATKDINLDHLSKQELIDQRGNIKGNWEDLEILDLNNHILASVGKNWYSILPVTNAQYKIFLKSPFFNEAVDLIKKKFQNSNFSTLKEPRITKLLPFWRQVFRKCNLRVSYLFAYRYPLDVANSLKRRDQQDILTSLYLWYADNLFSLKELIHEKRMLFIDYDSFLKETSNYLNILEEFLQIPQNVQERDIFLHTFLDQDLNHSKREENDYSSYPTFFFQLYDAIKASSHNEISFSLDNYLDWFEKHRTICSYCDNHHLQLQSKISGYCTNYLKFYYFRCRILAEITHGKKKHHYQTKKNEVKRFILSIK